MQEEIEIKTHGFFYPNSRRFHRLAKEGVWIIVGQIVSVLASIVLVRVLSEYLTPTQYGQLALGLTIAVLINQVVMGGISNGISRFYSIAAEKKDLVGYFRSLNWLLLYVTLTVLVIGLIFLWVLSLLGFLQWLGLAAAAIIYSILDGYNSTLSGIQNAARQRAIVAFHAALNAWLKILIVLGVFFFLGVSSTLVIFAFTLSTLLISGSQSFFLRKLLIGKSLQAREAEQWSYRIMGYSWPFSLWGIFTWAQLSSDRWALESFATTQEVGWYAVLIQLGYTPISMATGMVMSFLGPILYQRSGDATDDVRNVSVHRIAWRITLFALLLTFIVFLIALGLHEWIFRILVATDYRAVSYLLPWIVLAGGLFAAGQMLSVKLTSEMRPKAMIQAKIVTACLGVVLNLVGVYLMGLNGAAVALVVFSASYFLWMTFLSFDRITVNHTPMS